MICQYEFFRDIRLRENWQNQHYALGRDIDARSSWSANPFDRPCEPFDGETQGDCGGWEPFELEGGAFSGGIDGRGHVIMNLFSTNQPQSGGVGINISQLNRDRLTSSGVIFNNGSIGEDGYIRNLGFVDLRVLLGVRSRDRGTSNVPANFSANTALLAPENRGSIDNVYIVDQEDTETGGLNSGNSDGFLAGGSTGDYRAGLVSFNRGRIRNSFTDINFSGVGHLAAESSGGNSLIRNCYTRGDLDTNSDGGILREFSGGLIVRDLNGPLENVYSTGSVTNGDLIRLVTPLFGDNGNLVSALGSNGRISGSNFFTSRDDQGGDDGLGEPGASCGGVCRRPDADPLDFIRETESFIAPLQRDTDMNLDQYRDAADNETAYELACGRYPDELRGNAPDYMEEVPGEYFKPISGCAGVAAGGAPFVTNALSMAGGTCPGAQACYNMGTSVMSAGVTTCEQIGNVFMRDGEVFSRFTLGRSPLPNSRTFVFSGGIGQPFWRGNMGWEFRFEKEGTVGAPAIAICGPSVSTPGGGIPDCTATIAVMSELVPDLLDRPLPDPVSPTIRSLFRNTCDISVEFFRRIAGDQWYGSITAVAPYPDPVTAVITNTPFNFNYWVDRIGGGFRETTMMSDRIRETIESYNAGMDFTCGSAPAVYNRSTMDNDQGLACAGSIRDAIVDDLGDVFKLTGARLHRGVGALNPVDLSTMPVTLAREQINEILDEFPRTGRAYSNTFREISTLPDGWSADDWNLRTDTQVPALKFGGGEDICGDICGETMRFQRD